MPRRQWSVPLACFTAGFSLVLAPHAVAQDEPILVVAHDVDPFGRYYAEILHAEGLNELQTVDAGALDAVTLARHAAVLLAPGALSREQVELLRAYVDGGGNLVAMRPTAAVAELAGVTPRAVTLADAYFAVDTTSPPGAGITARALQYHGVADLFSIAPDARTIASLRAHRDDANGDAAVVLRAAGTHGGHVAAFAFDVARSVVMTRQGNPAWAGQERDGLPPVRPDDLFYPDWVDLENLDIPQADELMRLLTNVILRLAAPRLPLPRFAYLPGAARAAVVLTADDHGTRDGIAARFDALLATRAPGCSLEDWSCTSATEYLWTTSVFTPEQATRYRAQGFELGWHVDTQCLDWGGADRLGMAYDAGLDALSAHHPNVPRPRTIRTHCIVWSDWATQPKVELAHGIRLDTNYYHWPAAWLGDRTGLFTGSALPMRFADIDGTPIDVYQAPTQLDDEAGQTYPAAVDALLDRATGPMAYVGVFVANLHTDAPDDVAALAVVDSARRHGVPVISSEQLLDWLDARDAASFRDVAWTPRGLAFTVVAGPGASRLVALLPTVRGGSTLAGLSLGGRPVPFSRQAVRGVDVAVFQARPGTYLATYAPSRAGARGAGTRVVRAGPARVREVGPPHREEPVAISNRTTGSQRSPARRSP